MRRAAIPKDDRVPFTLYVDEFQNYTAEGSAFAKMLSEARKYELQLVLANQFTAQLSKSVADAIFGNVFTMITFQLGPDDARYMQKALPDFTPEDLQNLGVGQAVMRCGKAQDSFSLSTFPPLSKPETDFTQAIIDHSRATYGIPIQEILDQQQPEPTESADQSGEEDIW